MWLDLGFDCFPSVCVAMLIGFCCGVTLYRFGSYFVLPVLLFVGADVAGFGVASFC